MIPVVRPVSPAWLLAAATWCGLAFVAACGSDAATSTIATIPAGLPVMDRGAMFSAARAELGKKLFFDPRLSVDGTMACQSCHQHELGWTDGKQFSRKVDGSLNTRNSPSLYNVGYQDVFYWDGRAATLEKNIDAAWRGHMKGDPAAVAATLAAIPEYAGEFQQAFGNAPTGDDIVHALASFVRTLLSGDAPFDRHKRGEKGAMSADAIAGYELFSGKAKCAVCHTEPLFTDRGFHNVGIGMQAESPDPGRGKIDAKMPGAFKTPSLRSVAKTAPYFHDGSVATLEEAVTIMARGGIPNDALDPQLRNMPEITDEEIAQIVAFLEALTSEETFAAPKLPQ